MTLYKLLLLLHIAAGAIALISGIFASSIKQFNWPHHWHKLFGLAFFFSMAVIFLTALPMSLIKPNMFLLFISIFSIYFAYTGWRYAKNSSGHAEKEDWLAVVIMSICCIGMGAYGATMLLNHDNNGITLLVFAGIGIANAARNGYCLYTNQLVGSRRIALHATMMLAGSIATVTAFIVTNFSSNPEYILWIAPTILITPYIIYWNVKLTRS